MRDSHLSNSRVIALLLHYFAGYLFVYPVVAGILVMLIDSDAVEYPPLVQAVLYSFVLVVTIFLAYPLIADSIVKFFKKPKTILKDTVIRFIWLYCSMIVCNMILYFLLQDSGSNNQQEIMEALSSNRWITSLVTILFAPIVEEVIFRGCFFRKLREKFNFRTCLILSSAAFGFLHIYQSLLAGDFLDCAYILTYAVMGFHFGILYEKHDTIIACMLLHFLNNFVATLMLLLSF